jgi:hypothetical protein
MLGFMHWVANFTRPDISPALSLLSSRMRNPTTDDYHAVRGVAHYLANTKDLGLTYTVQTRIESSPAPPVGYSDASHNDHPDGSSTGGQVITWLGGAVPYRSKKHLPVDRATGQSEYTEAAHASADLVFVRNILSELGVPYADPFTLHVDNNSALAFADTDTNSPKSKHFRLRYHFIRDAISAGLVKVQKIGSIDQLADLFTKSLLAVDFAPFRRQLGLIPLNLRG